MSEHKWFSLLIFAGVGCWLLVSIVGCGDSGRSVTDGRSVSANYSEGAGVPAWANFTINLRSVQGSDEGSQARARQILEEIREQTGWGDLHILRIKQLSLVCRGYFQEFGNAKAQRILEQVRKYKDSRGDQPFQQARFAVIPRERKEIKVGPAQWDLRRAGGNSSLCIGSFINAPDCKDRAVAAVKLVRKMRKEGIEAWYYHGEYRSGVYVGHFRAKWERVTSGKTRSGELIRGLVLVSRDPEFAALRRKFPAYAYNGKIAGRMIGKQRTFEASTLVMIPKFGEKVDDAEVGLR